MSKITFIIPSIGRSTLKETIESLEKQTNKNWNAIIIFDGCTPNFQTDDSRVKIIQIEKLGQGINSAGLVRNEGIKIAETEWVAFVDDDDTLAVNYVETFYNDLQEFNDYTMVDVTVDTTGLSEEIHTIEHVDTTCLSEEIHTIEHVDTTCLSEEAHIIEHVDTTGLSEEAHIIEHVDTTGLSEEAHTIEHVDTADLSEEIHTIEHVDTAGLNENNVESNTRTTQKEKNPNEVDVIIYRMKSYCGSICPELSTDNFYNNLVGISFAMKKKIFDDGIQFIPAGNEDFIILDRIRAENNYNIMISPYIRYFVRNVSKGEIEDHTNNHIIGNRVFIKP
jgi:glycosyltransferase involved in cell wall biosynthesis